MIAATMIVRLTLQILFLSAFWLLNALWPSFLSARQPNVVLILTDDQGWGDVGVNGNANLQTPNIDRLAREGATLTHFYVCQVCAPTRAELLTGRYYPRTGVSGVSEGKGRLNADETTLADLFRAAGYSTGCFGKWHNGTQTPLHPNDRGFDEFYGFTSGHWGHYFSPPLDHNGRRVRGRGFVVDDVTERAIDFIQTNRDRPFFCYVPLNTPHSPMMVPDRFYDKFKDLDPQMRHRDPAKEDLAMTRAALALCENIDWNVGRILAKLEETNLDEETIVIYMSDNGPNSFRWNGGMKGRKGAIDEGGLRVPFFIRWPTQIRAGSQVESVGAAIDLLPTLLECAGIDARPKKPLDGRSLRSALVEASKPLEPRLLFSIKNKQVSVRTGRYRLDAEGRLFDVIADPGQRKDLSDQHQDLTSRLRRAAAEHGRTMQTQFAKNSVRPFHVGHGEDTTLPARDGVAHGAIQRSARAPNNSFFTNWISTEDSITWDIDIGKSGTYEAIVYYTCPASAVGARVQLGVESGESVGAVVKQEFDPPLYGKSKDRVANSHYFVKDFRPLSLGKLELKQGRAVLRLGATEKPGSRIIDVHSVRLIRKPTP